MQHLNSMAATHDLKIHSNVVFDIVAGRFTCSNIMNPKVLTFESNMCIDEALLIKFGVQYRFQYRDILVHRYLKHALIPWFAYRRGVVKLFRCNIEGASNSDGVSLAQ